MGSKVTYSLLLFFVFTLCAQAKDNGEDCVDTSECDATKWLECLEGKCACPAKSYYDAINQPTTCRKFVREECATSASMPCPFFGVCKSNLIKLVCNCNSGFESTPTLKCAIAHGKGCQNTAQCDPDAFLECAGTPKLCSCPPNSAFDDRSKSCRLNPGQVCVDSTDVGVQQCARYSNCTLDPETGDSKCKCEAGLEASSAGYCVVKFGEECSENSLNFPPCDKLNGVTCLEKKCQCAKNSHVDSSQSKCYLDVGQACSDPPVPEKGSCDGEKFNECLDKICGCPPGSKLDANDVCVLDFDATCNPAEERCDPSKYLICSGTKCSCASDATKVDDMCVLNHESKCVPGGQPCNPSQFLGCHDGTCGCEPGAEFDPVLKTCVLLHNQACSAKEGPLCDDRKYLSCDKIIGKCLCDSNALWDNDRFMCFLNISAQCQAGGQECNPSTFYVCSSGRCNCDSNVGAILNDLMCVIEPAHACQIGDDKQPCNPSRFLTCEQSENGNFCGCKDGSVMDTDQVCVLNLGSTCSSDPGQQLCNPKMFLTCDQDQLCTCGDHATLDAEKNICLLNYKSSCANSLAQQPCDNRKFLSCLQSKCDCAPDSHWNAQNDGTCYLSYTSPCGYDTISAICDPTQLLICNEGGACGCGDKEVTIFDPFNNKCALVTNAPCRHDYECIQNSACNGTCTCKDDFYANSVGKCVREFNDLCSDFSDDYCNIEGNQACDLGQDTCGCADVVHMEFVPEDDFCYTKARGNCDVTSTTIQCLPPLLLCDATTSKCICDPALGFVDDDGHGKCLKTFGSVCNRTDGAQGSCDFDPHGECLEDNKCECSQNYVRITGTIPRCAGYFDSACADDLECLSSASLGCNQETKKCSCVDNQHQIYDEPSGLCQSVLGGPCNLTLVNDPDPILLCKDGLQCQSVDDQHSKIGTCGNGAGTLVVNLFMLVCSLYFLGH